MSRASLVNAGLLALLQFDVGGASAGGIVAVILATREEMEGKRFDEVFGDDFVEHFAGTREHEIRLWDEAVTDW